MIGIKHSRRRKPFLARRLMIGNERTKSDVLKKTGRVIPPLYGENQQLDPWECA
ncbi:hypothetical protein ABIE49_002663 [Bradyrhizobium sp. OAE829]